MPVEDESHFHTFSANCDITAFYGLISIYNLLPKQISDQINKSYKFLRDLGQESYPMVT